MSSTPETNEPKHIALTGGRYALRRRPRVKENEDATSTSSLGAIAPVDGARSPASKRLKPGSSSKARKSSSSILERVNFTELLPLELMLKIFGYLYEGDLVRCALVSRKFRAIADHQILWKALYQEVFEYSRPLLHVGRAQFEFREPHDWPQLQSDKSIVVNPWKESFKQLKDGIHVRPGYASLYSGFGTGGRRLTQCNRLEQALRLVEARGENAEKLIFLHAGLYILKIRVGIGSDIQIIGASAGPDIASRVIIEGQLETAVILAKGCQGAYLGWTTIRFAPNPEVVAAAIAFGYPLTHMFYCALLICSDSTALVEHCVVHSSAIGWTAVCVEGRATNPKMRHCVVYDCEGAGIHVTNAAQGQFEDCEIARNNGPGIEVVNHANPFFRRCHIHDGQAFGIHVHSKGRGQFMENRIHSNKLAGIAIESRANPAIWKNEIYNGLQGGIYILREGRGLIEENEVYGNTFSCISVTTESSPIIRKNRIHSGKQAGVYFYDNGQGVLEENDIFNHLYSGVEIKTGSNPEIARNKIRGNQGGVLIRNNGQGVLEENEIFDNAETGVWIDTDSNPMLRRNKIYDERGVGVYISDKGRGILEENDIYRNAQAGVLIKSESNPTLRGNCIYEGHAAGIEIMNGAMATLESNAIFKNRFGGLFLATGVRPTLRDNKIYDNDDLVEKTIAKGGCLFDITSCTSPAMHDYYRCDTCNTTEEDKICLNCIRTCHAGHTVHLVRCDRFFCSCGVGTLKHQCKLQSKVRDNDSAPPVDSELQ